MWQRSLEIIVNSVGLRTVLREVAVVNDLIAYLQSCLDGKHREAVAILTDKYELGVNKATGRVGILFLPWLVDMRATASRRDGPAADDPKAGSASS